MAMLTAAVCGSCGPILNFDCMVRVAAAAMAIGLVASGCSSSNSGTATTRTMTSKKSSETQAATTPSQAATSTPTAGSSNLQSLIPTPSNTQRTDGPDSIPDNGVHLHFFGSGSPKDVMAAYKTALEGKGWSVTVVSSGSGGDGGGATYTATQGNTYGVFSGGGSGSTTDIGACPWPSKPANPNCGNGNR
jgi:hypothetical protein